MAKTRSRTIDPNKIICKLKYADHEQVFQEQIQTEHRDDRMQYLSDMILQHVSWDQGEDRRLYPLPHWQLY